VLNDNGNLMCKYMTKDRANYPGRCRGFVDALFNYGRFLLDLQLGTAKVATNLQNLWYLWVSFDSVAFGRVDA
jgi:hypothetical protein